MGLSVGTIETMYLLEGAAWLLATGPPNACDPAARESKRTRTAVMHPISFIVVPPCEPNWDARYQRQGGDDGLMRICSVD